MARGCVVSTREVERLAYEHIHHGAREAVTLEAEQGLSSARSSLLLSRPSL
jgi:hypothetical protein